jgi:pimeloyl-ACP methyl ester carboxylesterase
VAELIDVAEWKARSMRRAIAVATAVGLLLGGVSGATSAQATPGADARVAAVAATALRQAPAASASALASGDAAAAAAATSRIAWGACADPDLQAVKAQCGYLSVPLDHRRPTKARIQLAVSRIQHTVPAAEFQGILLVNPGGPGGSGLALPAFIAGRVPNGVGAAYDWIGFDPRGVGASKPALACDSTYFGYDRPPYVPASRSIEAAWLAKAKGYAKACDSAGGRLLDHLKTTDTVKDMDAIRAALGQKKLNLYGFSYGTYLGQVYSTLFPSKVRRMVLDGNVDPRGVWYRANLSQDTAFDRNIKVFFGWIADRDGLYQLGTTAEAVESAYYATQQKLFAEPAAGVIGPDEWNDLFVSAGYSVRAWPGIAGRFAGFVNDGDAAALKAAFDASFPTTEGSDNGYAMYLATQCSDVQWPTAFRTWRRDNDRIHATAPFLTWNNAWYNAPCLTWGAKAGKPVQVNGKKAPGLLLISETLDAATPFAGALEVRSRFPKSSLIEGVGGTTHSASLNGVACVDNAVAEYLSTGKLPKRVGGRQSDLKCGALPQPAGTVYATRTESSDLSKREQLIYAR